MDAFAQCPGMFVLSIYLFVHAVILLIFFYMLAHLRVIGEEDESEKNKGKRWPRVGSVLGGELTICVHEPSYPSHI